MKKWVRSLLAVVCSAVIAAETLPAAAFAVESSAGRQELTSESEAAAEPQDPVEEPLLVGEEISKREEEVKVFRRSDGAYVAASYNEPVHYQKDGEWKDIDNTLVSIQRDGKGYRQNKASDFKVSLPNFLDRHSPVYLEYAGKTVAFELETPRAANAAVVQPEASRLDQLLQRADQLKAEQGKKTAANAAAVQVLDADIAAVSKENVAQAIQHEMTSLHKLTAEVAYAAPLPDVDLTYDLKGRSLKESLILNRLPEQESFTFHVDSGGLTASLQEDGSVVFRDGDTDVLAIQAPYMWDANDEYSDAVTVTLTEEAGGYRYTVTPDREWLEAEERAYPVTVDPTFVVGTRHTIKDTTMVFGSSTPSGVTDKRWLFTGSMSGVEIGAAVYKELPKELSLNSRLISASLNLYYQQDNQDTSSPDLQVNAIAIDRNWNVENISVDEIIHVESGAMAGQPVLDYAIMHDRDLQTSAKLYTFDVTKAAQQWLDDPSGHPNYGILLKAYNNPKSTLWMRFYSSDYIEAGCPLYMFTYRDTKGLESYWTHHDQDLGRSGVGAINDFSGRLVYIHGDASTASNYMPASVSHVYNSLSSDRNFSWRTSDPDYMFRPLTGYGWKLDVQQRLSKIPESSDPDSLYQRLGERYKYIYTDKDGTEHYLYENDDGKIVDEDGLGLTFKARGEGELYDRLVMEDGSSMQFEVDGGWVRDYTPADEHSVRGGYLYKYGVYYLGVVEDGAKKQLQLDLNESYYLTTITDIAGRITRYSYTGNLLTQITYPDGGYTKFTYQAKTIAGTTYNLLTRVEDENGTAVEYGYDAKGRVVSVTEWAKYSPSADSWRGQKMTISYPDYNTTEYRTSGKDDVYGNDDDILTTYVFDNWGRTISTYSKRADNKEEYGGSQYSYTAGSGAEVKNSAINRVEQASSGGKMSTNLLKNHSAEWTNSYWSNRTWDANAAAHNTFFVDKEMGYHSAWSWAITKTASETPTQAFWCHEDSTTYEPGKTYTASAYVYAPDLPEGDLVEIGLWEEQADGSTRIKLSEALRQPTGDGWERLSVTVTVPENPTDLFSGVYLFYYGSHAGTVHFDCVQLEEGEVANPYNWLENTEMEQDGTNGSGINDWDPVTTGGSYAKSYETLDGGRALRINGRVTDATGVSQRMFMGSSGQAKSTYVLSLWAKGNSAANETAKFGVRIHVHYNTGESRVIEESFDKNCTGWQYMSLPFCLEDRDNPSRRPVNVDIDLMYANNVNYAVFDKVQVLKDEVPSYTYDKDGNLVSVEDNEREQQFSSDRGGNVAHITDPKGNFAYYDYDSTTELLMRARNTSGIEYNFTRDSFGNVTESSVVGNPALESIVIDTPVYVRNKKSGEILSAHSETEIITYYALRAGDQVWEIRISSAGHYYLWAAQYGLFLRSNAAGNMDLYKWYTNADTELGIEVSEDGAFRFKHKSTGKYLAVEDGGRTVTLAAGDTKDWNQYWYMERVTPLEDTSIKSTASYSTKGDFTESVTDSRGVTTEYGYNHGSGVLNSVTAAQGTAQEQTVSYTYNQLNDLLTKVQQGDAAVEYVYNAKRYLSEIKHNGFSYTMGYDQFGNRVNTKVGNRLLTLNEFANGNGKLAKSTYGNGAYVSYGYDALGRVVSRSYNGAEAFRYLYANDGKLGKLVDRVNGVQTMFNYDTIGRLSSWWDSQGNRGGYAYDLNNNLTNWNYLVFGKKIAQEYTYGVDDVLQKSVLPGYTAEYTYDSLLRLKEKSLPGNKTLSYTYHDGVAGSTTTLLKKLSGAGLLDVEYAYDALGNITSIKENGVVQVSYEYDAYNQLVKETYQNGDVIEYSYDNGGNLLSKTVNSVVSNSYTYGDTEWKDLLTGFNGTTITYDEIGNPQNWRDGMSFTWVNGRQLGALQKGDLGVSYSYNSDGLRVSKVVNGAKTEYVWDGSSLIGQKTGNNVLVYLYAADGLAGFQYNGVNYYYLKNGQGDVVGILNSSGTLVAKYTYDAWGKLLSVTDAAGTDKSADASFIGNINLIRYRSYYYDTETGLYYLQSRYYDPEVGRFINADGLLGANEDILAYNLFAYCGNNPVNGYDPSGRGNASFKAVPACPAVVWDAILSSNLGKNGIRGSYCGSVKRGSFDVHAFVETFQMDPYNIVVTEYYTMTKSVRGWKNYLADKYPVYDLSSLDFLSEFLSVASDASGYSIFAMVGNVVTVIQMICSQMSPEEKYINRYINGKSDEESITIVFTKKQFTQYYGKESPWDRRAPRDIKLPRGEWSAY